MIDLESIITDKHCENCPCSWQEHICNEACDEWEDGCYLTDDYDFKWFCLAPKFIRKILKNRHIKREIKAWEKYANEHFSDFM